MIRISILILALLAGAIAPGALLEPQTYWQMCDASAAVALDDSHFAVADDEGSILRIYKRGEPDPVREQNFTKFLGAKKGETDLEGGARIGNVVFWISSHARDKEGRPAPNRHRLFGTQITGADGLSLEAIGQPYQDLIASLIGDARFAGYRIDQASLISPKKTGGLNIEGMCARADGSLLIGFRGPVPNRNALLVPLMNPGRVIHGEKALFGGPIELDLGGFGIRDICPDGGGFLILAGSSDGAKEFRLHHWDVKSIRPIPGNPFSKLNPEALFRFPKDAPGIFQILSDDGGKKTGGKECKDLPKKQRHFRAGEIRIDRPE